MPLVIPPLGDIHVPSSDYPDKAPPFSLEDQHQETARSRRAKACVVAPLCPAENRGDGEYLFGLLRLNAMTECEMQHIPFIPLKSRDPQPGPPAGNTLHYRNPSRQGPQPANSRSLAEDGRRPEGHRGGDDNPADQRAEAPPTPLRHATGQASLAPGGPQARKRSTTPPCGRQRDPATWRRHRQPRAGRRRASRASPVRTPPSADWAREAATRPDNATTLVREEPREGPCGPRGCNQPTTHDHPPPAPQRGLCPQSPFCPLTVVGVLFILRVK